MVLMMEPSTGLRALNLAWPIRIRFSFHLPRNLDTPSSSFISFDVFKRKNTPSASNYRCLLSLSSSSSSIPRSSSHERRDFASSWSSDSLSQVPHDKILQIPGNTGCIARTCAASAVGLHLIEPLGFQIDDAKLKRAGLDYWPYVVVKVHGSWAEFKDYFRKQAGEKRLLAFTKRGTAIHSDFSYKRGDWLVFGSETCGLPPEVLHDCSSESLGGGTIRIPMVETYVRCLNLSVSVGIALYEASRQLNYEHLQYQPEASADNLKSFVSEDLFA